MHRARRSLALVAMLLAVAGCATRPAPLLRITGIFGAELHGRPFMFVTLEGPRETGPPDRFLQIEGDDVKVSFHVSARPFVPTIRGNAVHMGGHVFEATPTPNAFLVDGQPHALDRGGLYTFNDGRYSGQYTGR